MIPAVAAIIFLCVCFYLLAVICEEFFVPSLDAISHRLKLSSDAAGATFMAVGSSAPELFTSLFAVIKPGDHANIGTGTIVGSAIFNILVIIGASALFKTVKLNWQPVLRDALFYVLTILLLLFAFMDGVITIVEAAVFVCMYGVYIVAVVKWRRIFPYKDVDPIHILEDAKKNFLSRFSRALLAWVIPDPIKRSDLFVGTFTLSILAIAGLSYGLVESAVVIGDFFRINPTLIALTVLAAGTSIPDLLSSIIVAKQGRGDMAVSNAVGSNIFDILFCLGFPWLGILLVRGGTIPVSTQNLTGSVLLLFATVLAILFILVVRRWRIGQRSGLVLIGAYIAYVLYTYMHVR
jgi:K+-dependent Na+/Ca+ exchanger-like protein